MKPTWDDVLTQAKGSTGVLRLVEAGGKVLAAALGFPGDVPGGSEAERVCYDFGRLACIVCLQGGGVRSAFEQALTWLKEEDLAR